MFRMGAEMIGACIGLVMSYNRVSKSRPLFTQNSMREFFRSLPTISLHYQFSRVHDTATQSNSEDYCDVAGGTALQRT